MFITVIFLTAVVVFAIFLVAILALLYSEGKLMDKSKTSPFMRSVAAALVPKDKKRIVSEPASVPAIPASSPDGDKPENALNPGKPAGRVFAGVAIAALLMAGFILILLNAYKYITGSFWLADAVWVILLVTIAAAGGGAIGFRIVPLSWRQVVISGLLSGACIMLLSKYEFSPFYPGPWHNLEGGFDIRTFLLGAFFLGAPVFSLPLFDPAVRKNGVAPSLNGVTLAALGVTAFCILLDFFSPSSGLITLFVGSILTAVSLGIGLIVVLINPTDMNGVRIGGVGILLPIPIILAWYLLGAGWIP